MREKSRLALLFTIVGFIGALGATAFLWFFVGTSAPSVLGFHRLWLYFTFPLVGALSAGIWAVLFKPNQFGALQGALVALLSFVTVCVYACLIGAGFPAFLAFTMFGFILFGWAGVIIGAVTGHLFRRALVYRAR